MLKWPNPPHWRWPALVVLTLAVLIGCDSLDTQQRRWIFQATALQAPSALFATRNDGLDDLWIEVPQAGAAEPVRLHALWNDGPSTDAPLLLYLHGARRNVERSTFRIQQMRSLGFAVLAIDYRGFGLSTDALPSEDSVAADARAAWEWLGTHYPGRDRYIFGHSLGGAIAVQLASEASDAKGLIVEGTFTSIAEVFRSMRWGWLPITALITQRFDSADKIGRVKAPVLVVHGAADSLIRPELGRALFEHAKSPKRFVLVDGGTHYSTNRRGTDQYREALRELFGIGA